MSAAKQNGWLRRLFATATRPEPLEVWAVQFDEGGKVYTYRRTAAEFTQEMRERYLLRRELPHRVQVVRGGELCDVEFDTRALDR